jgi:hypothetical protein
MAKVNLNFSIHINREINTELTKDELKQILWKLINNQIKKWQK